MGWKTAAVPVLLGHYSFLRITEWFAAALLDWFPFSAIFILVHPLNRLYPAPSFLVWNPHNLLLLVGIEPTPTMGVVALRVELSLVSRKGFEPLSPSRWRFSS